MKPNQKCKYVLYLLEIYQCMCRNYNVLHVQVEGEGNNPPEDNVKAALARLASNENLNSSYDLVLGLVRRPPPPHTCRHPPPSPPPPQPRHHCPCHSQHHHR